MLEINMNHTLFYYISENKISDKVYMDNSPDIQKPIVKVVLDIKQLKIDMELINKLNAQGIKLFQDPNVGIELFLETQRFLKNRLAFNRAGLQIEPTEFLTVGVVPTGTSNDPIIIDKNDKNNTQGELYLNYLIQNDKNLKGVYVMFEEDGSVEKLDWEKIRKNQ